MRTKLSPAQALLIAGHPEEALKYTREEDMTEESLYLRAICHRHLGRFDIASGLLNELIEKNPSHYAGLNTAGMIATDIGAFYSAMGSFQEALEKAAAGHASAENLANIRLNCAYALMRLGKFEQAWPLFEAGRFRYSWDSPIVPWSGQPGKVVVICEGGYGDQVMFSRWLPRFHGQNGVELTHYCFAELADIMPDYGVPIIRHPRKARVSRGEIEVPWSKFDYATSIMSLPAIAQMKTVNDLPGDLGMWGYRRLPGEYLDGIGLCWEAEEVGVQRNSRSMDVNLFEPLAGPLKRDFVSLCPGRAHPSWVSDVALNSWVDTCTVLTRLHFVITIDTAVAHLAGALGVPTYILLPAGSDWKWFTQAMFGSASPWYPSVKLIRNTDPNLWAPAIEKLTEELKADGRL